MGLDCALYPPSHFSTSQTIGPHHPPGCVTPPKLPVASQSCAAVRFGSCVLRPNEPPRPCAECAKLAPKRRHIVRARTDAAEPASPLHLVVLAPPFWGSTALESLLASSPAVATLCGAGTWQCEPTELLERAGVFPKLQRWWPPTEPLAYWSAAFGALESHWDHATRPIRLVKAPPDLAKVESLLAYFGARGVPYRFVALTQHPCLLTESHRKHELLNISAYYLHTAVRATPPPNLYVLGYERLLADAEGAAQELADWLPALRELDLRKGLGLVSGGDGVLSVAE